MAFLTSVNGFFLTNNFIKLDTTATYIIYSTSTVTYITYTNNAATYTTIISILLFKVAELHCITKTLRYTAQKENIYKKSEETKNK